MPTTRTLTNTGAPLHSPDGELLSGVQIHFQLMDMGGRPSDAWDAISNERVGGETVIVTTDAAGEFSVDLWPNTRGNRETKYKCRVQFEGFREFSGVIEDVPGDLQWAAFMLAGSSMEPQDMSAVAAAITSHINAADPHTQYAKESELAAALATKVDSSDPRLSDAREWTATTVTQPEAEAGTDTVRKAWTALRVWQAIGAWWSASAAKAKLDGIATGATANATDAQLRDRATHTGAQAISTVTGLQGALDAKEAAGTAAAAVSAHAAAGDPHPQYTTAAEAAASAPVQSVAGKTGAVTLAKADVGLSNVDNTSDANKPVSTAQAAAIATATAIHPFLLIGA